MTDAPPILLSWDGEAFHPANQHWARKCDNHYVVGQTYQMVEHHDRSMRSHNHFFAAVTDAWRTLPEEFADRFPSSEHLRKWCLIKTGYRDERSIVCSSRAEAQRVAAFVRPIDDCAVVVVREAVVIVWTAKSQSMRAMGKATFQASKDDVLSELASMIKTRPGELAKNAREAA